VLHPFYEALALLSKTGRMRIQVPVKMRVGMRNSGVFEIRFAHANPEVVTKWLASESSKQEAGQWSSLHFLQDSGFILDSSAQQ
jgi:hypothetical protein